MNNVSSFPIMRNWLLQMVSDEKGMDPFTVKEKDQIVSKKTIFAKFDIPIIMSCEEYIGYGKYLFDYCLDLILHLMSINLFYLR